MTDVLSRFADPVGEWFRRALGAPTPVQERGWGPIADGKSAILLAPTGSGKTLAAFLAGLDRLMFPRDAASAAELGRGVRLLYVSPLKALAVDVERNLRAPLAGIAAAAERAGIPARVPSVAIRSGDTPAAERARFRKHAADILITTPESLYLLLTSQAREQLVSVETVILDEIHALIATKRGAHLALSLERLERLREGRKPLQRIGLSATVRPLDEAAAFLGGNVVNGDAVVRREVVVVDAAVPPRLKLRVEVPVESMAELGSKGEDRSIWPALHAPLVELIRKHRSTLLFVNSRRLAERLAAALNDAAGEPLVLAHHGSIARDRRTAIEDALKLGELRALVATSSLELGIDMGAIDLVVQIEAPPSVATGLQRIGRAGHSVGGVSEGVVFPKFRGDLLAAAATAEQMLRGEVESSSYPRNPLDVLAQQIVAIASEGTITEEALYALARSAAPFHALPRSAFESVLDLLSGRYPSDEFAELKARLVWDRVAHTITARQGARHVAIVNGGTIPDRGLYGVFLASAPEGKSVRVGELDEEMVFESRTGDVFLLGASSWRIEDITFDRVLVSPAPGQPGKMPFWHGDRPGRPLPLGRAIGKLARELTSAAPEKASERLTERGLDPRAAQNLLEYLREEREAVGEVPSDRQIVIEEFADELGDHRVCVLSPFGSRVHAPWALACMELHRRALDVESEAVWSDDGIVFRFPEARPLEDLGLIVPDPATIDDLLTRSLAQSSLFASRFRENAARALLLPRKRPGQRAPLWAQRRRAADLLRAASKYPDFPILLETYRECLRDVFDVPGLKDILGAVERREIRVARVATKSPSPFAASLLFSYVGNFIYDGDAPLAERRAHALTIDTAELRALLGEAELRSLLDPDAMEEVERDAQRLGRPIDHPDRLHDVFLAVGDLDLAEARARLAEPGLAEGWLAELERARRVVPVIVAGERRFIAAEHAARYRDALGVVLPLGLPEAFLGATKDALFELVSRYARTHAPFPAAAPAARFGLAAGRVALELERLEREGRVVRGEFLPHGRGLEWCDGEVLRRIKQKSLAKLRRAVEPVDTRAYARLLLEWQGAEQPRGGHDVLPAVIDQLEGAPLVASALETHVLPARVARYLPAELDALSLSGEIVWRGLESLGPNDGRVAFYRADRYALVAPDAKPAEGELAEKVRAALRASGASFFNEILAKTRVFPRDLLEVLWDMVWAGELTNDTLAPLRARLGARAGKDRPRRPGSRRPRPSALPGSEGRWSLLERWLPDTPPSPTERLAARAEVLLERYGVLTREAVLADGLGSFAELYPVLKGLEDAGRIRRGYFVAGLGATQFARAGADDRLRLLREPNERAEPVVLAATDPANPYGAALPWPEIEPRPQRAAGALVVLADGALLGYLGRTERALVTVLPEDTAERARAEETLGRALAGLVGGAGRRALVIEKIDGVPARESRLGAALLRAGFSPSSDGYGLRGERPAQAAHAGR